MNEGRTIRADFAELDYAQKFIGGVADSLEGEVKALAKRMTTLLDNWDGLTSKAYRTEWDDWHEGATEVIAALRQSIEALGMARAALSEADAAGASLLGDTYVPLNLGNRS
ncbi:WXG100 family type VII secretion target [Gordonia sp. 852002-50395_SCH5434458]|uniref:WXG100 family type VII secretion target n=1 Tax=Gordonia sp. 852002-50395_SCH5434458 TaxID=1834090 RepID=UPI0007EAAAAB|nr:WXG100 family type VII secretion target [Gordonia sp. 852002-50395_SCH5434458]OBC02709.1 hypothetical protein A5785_02535 [Gordonia sp. 852002-50395_SCH5434458]